MGDSEQDGGASSHYSGNGASSRGASNLPQPIRPSLPTEQRLKSKIADPRVRLVQNQCLKMALGILNRPHGNIRTIGFTSSIPGEGKSLMALVTATALASRSHRPVTLLDCNWDNPELHDHFNIPGQPGLAEWLREECDLADIRYSVSPFLTVIPSGDAQGEGLALTERLRAVSASALLRLPDEALIAELPSVLTTDYGARLAEELGAVLLVVRAGVTQEAYIAEASRELENAALEGAVLNATHTAIPRWLARLL